MYLTISPINEINPVKKVSFGTSNYFGKLPKIASDTFEGSIPKSLYNPKFEESVDKIFAKVEAVTNTFTSEMLETIINSLKTSFPNRSEKEILSTIQRLTQWANYPSLEVVGNFIQQEGIKSPISLEGINPLFTYFQLSKGLLPYNQYFRNSAFFVTKGTINEAISFSKNIDLEKKVKFINLEGFDDGVNLFTDDAKLESSVKKALSFVEQNPQMSFSEAIDNYLNRDIVSKLQNIGASVTTLTRPTIIPNRKTIIEQMSPYKPKKEDIRLTFQKIGLNYADSIKEYHFLTNNMAKYFEDKLTIHTKQDLIDGLNKLNVLINKFAMDNNIEGKNIYYVIPREESGFKSFDVITHMYKQQFNIPESQIIRLADMSYLDKYKEKSAFVILDDFVGSGDCYTSAANYNQSNIFVTSRNVHILYCPIIGYEKGLEHIKTNNILKGRTGLDHVLIPKENIIRDYNVNKAYSDLADSTTGRYIAGFEGYQYEYACQAFPYMTPDNNTDLASIITRFFFPTLKPIKNCHQDLIRVADTSLSDIVNLYSKIKNK